MRKTVTPDELMKVLFPEHAKKVAIAAAEVVNTVNKTNTVRSTPRAGEVYKHFKGRLYRIIGIARDCTNDNTRQVVVYQSLDKKRLCVRELSEFMSPVDHKKYPDCKAYWRFHKQPSKPKNK